MHVLHLIDTLALGGAERMLVDIANCSVAKGLTVSVCQSRSAGPLSEELLPSIARLNLERKTRLDFPAMKMLANFIRKNNVDIVHVHSRSSLQLLIVVMLLNRVNTRVLFHDHYGKIDIDRGIPLWFRVFAVRLITVYVGVSAALAGWARCAGMEPTKVLVMPNYIDFERLVPKTEDPATFDLPHADFLGVVVCGLREEKGIHALIQALAQLKTAALKVVVVGGEAEAGYLQRCIGLAKDFGVADRIVFAGKRRDIVSNLHRFDLGIMPSISESGPLVLIEYLANGLPIIATRTGEIGAIIEKSGVGRFVAPGDVRELAMAIDEFLELSPEQRKAEGEKGIAVARDHFDLGNKIDVWLDLYRNCMKAA